MMLQPGTMLQERYEILEKIGSGGMSEVYKAKCHKLNRLVAIKVLKTEFTSDATFVSKFKMEAQAAAGLSHPNIVSIYDVVDEGDIHFIVMELVEGITLKSYITKKGRLDVRESIGIALQVAQGIEAAHEQHIIHRDIKPQNMLISRDGKVKVADFGIARAVSSQTMNSNVVGSVHYISPEQARGGYSDERSDIYSLGITMFEMVTGRLPFEGDNTVTVALAHLEEPIPLPSAYNPEVSPSLERIILKCTEKRPENRYSNAAEVITDLRRALLNPDDPVIALSGVEGGEEIQTSHTITMSRKDLELIQGRVSDGGNGSSGRMDRDPRAGREPEVWPDRALRAGREPEGRSDRDLRNGRNSEGRMARGDGDGRSGQGNQPGQFKRRSQDETTQIEKILTALGVVAAIIVVAVVVVFFTKLGGLFSAPTPGKDQLTTEASAETESTQEEEPSEKETLSQKEVRMPNVVGDTQEVAEEKLAALDLVMQVEQQNSDEVAKDVVISQVNEEGSVVARYSKVTVVVSAGSDKIGLTELNLTSMTLDTAVRLLEGKGLKTAISEESSDTIEKGEIIRTEPADKAAYGSTVLIYVSSGPKVETVLVPKLEGESEENAQTLIDDGGLMTGEVSTEFSDTVPAGTIISQGIPAGEEVEVDTAIDYTVSKGPRPVEKQFIGSLEASYPLTVSFGPGAGSSEIQILIRLKQKVNGQDVYTKLTDIKSYSSDTTLQIKFDRIRGADGVTTGEVEIVDLTNNVILTSYNVTFTETEVS